MTVVVAGAGGLGREIAGTVDAASRNGGPIFAGFLDDGAAVGRLLRGPCQPGSLGVGESLIIGVGDPGVRFSLAARFLGTTFATTIHPSAVVSSDVTLGVGVFVGPFAYLGPGAVVGDHVVLNVHTAVGHDAAIGDWSVVSPYATLNGGASVGAGVLLGTSAVVSIGVQVGRWSKVSAGSVVTRDVGEGHLVAGIPARGRQMFPIPSIPT